MMMNEMLSHWESQIAEVERRLDEKNTPSARKVLEREHERLVAQVQRWTVGTVKAGQVA